MPIKSILFFICNIFFLSLPVFAQTNQIFEEEKLCLENRLKMKTWHIVFNRNIVDKEDTDRNNVIQNVYIYDINRQRSDKTKLQESLDKEIKPCTRTYFYDGKRMHSYESGIDKDGATWALEFRTPDGSREKEQYESYFDVRILGMNTSGIYLRLPLTALITTSYPEIKRGEIVDETCNGIPCKKITYILDNRPYSHCWIAPSKGYSVIRFEIRSTDGIYYEYTDLKVQEYKNSGIWYPYYSKFERYENNELTISEEMDIDVISINEPIDDKYFSLASLNIPPGTMVADPELGRGNYVWDGKEVVSEDFYRYGSGIPQQSPRSRYFVLLAINLLIIGIYFLWKFHSTKIK
ncbi:MAG: outer membrane lipoprotein-sorting protein [Planctomycetaceae bacterium]|jgi:hypothetical protein|nr:outer membrane lipoprotein-sorting protein [Planctomycetaceae bacterium]